VLRADPNRAFGGRAKASSFFLGRALPLDTPVRVSVTGAGEAAAQVVPEADVVARTLVVSRSAEGVESTDVVADWPSARATLGLPVPGDYTVTVTDAWGNTGSVAVESP
jgi:hypothetical protein